MKTLKPLAMTFVAGALALAGCAEQPAYRSQAPQGYPQQQQYPSQQYPSQGYPQQQQYPSQGYNTGTVDRIEVINRSDSNNVAGMVIGGVVGGLIGNQIGHGSGRTVATVAGAAGGAYVGNKIEGRQRASHESFRISVRMNDGSYRTVNSDNVSDLQTGDRVRVEGNNVYRI